MAMARGANSEKDVCYTPTIQLLRVILVRRFFVFTFQHLEKYLNMKSKLFVVNKLLHRWFEMVITNDFRT